MSYLLRALPLLVLAALSACEAKPQASQPSGGAPKGEIWLSSEQVKQAQLKIAPVESHELSDHIITSGRVTFDDAKVTHVFSPVTGRLTKIMVGLGQNVKAGEPLAELESPDLAQAYSDQLKADADLVAAKHDVDRQRELADAGAAAQAILEQSEDNFRKAQAEMERAKLKTKLLHAQSGTSVEQAFLLRSPIAGEVVGRNVNPGIEVQGMLSGASIANELFTVGSIDSVWLMGDLYESELGRVKPGDQVALTAVAYPDATFKGIIDYVSDVLDPQTHTAHLRCSIQNAEHKLMPEMFVTAQVSIGQRQVVAVPRTAVLRLSDQSVVFVQVGRTEAGLLRFAVRPVKTGDDESGWVEIREGLRVGEQLVNEGAILLSSQV